MVYRPLAHGPTPSPPKPSQSDAPTGWTPSASAVSASPQPSATTRVGLALIVTPPNLVATVAGNAASDDADAADAVGAPVVCGMPDAQALSARQGRDQGGARTRKRMGFLRSRGIESDRTGTS